MRHPLTESVHHVSLGGVEFGLVLVENQLKNGEFSTTEQFFNAIEDVWQQSVPPLGPYGPMFLAENRKLVDRERKRLGLIDKRSWGSYFMNTRAKFYEFLSIPPPLVKSLASGSFVKRIPEKPQIPVVTQASYKRFVKAAKMISDEDSAYIAQVIKQREPDHFRDGEEISLNVANLKLETFREIENIARGALGERYPGKSAK